MTTKVDGRRSGKRWTALLGLVMLSVGATLIIAPQPAAAATSCSSKWHTIKASAVDRKVTFHHGYFAYSDGRQGVEVWNQQILFCRDPRWIANHYGIYTNYSGGYCGANYDVDGNSTDFIHCGWAAIYDTQQLFEIKRYDSKFWSIKLLGTGGCWTASSPRDVIEQYGGTCPASGDQLFEIDGTPPDREPHP